MERREILARARQYLCARIDGFRYKFNLRLPPEAPELRDSTSARFFFLPAQVPGLCALLRELLPEQANDVINRAERISQHRFDLLGYKDLEYGKEIDWHADPVHGKRAPRRLFYQIRYLDFHEVGDSKISWELNRHQHFVTLAKAYRLAGDKRFADEIFRQWQHWHAENPYPMGINWASSLEVAFRSLSWLWTYFLLADSPAMTVDFRQDWLRAQAINGRHIERYLSTYFSPNTHLLGEAVALFFLGTLCSELPSAQRWKERGWETVLRESQRQVRPDGFHFEQSTYYHVYALDFFLHAALLASANGLSLPMEFERTLEKMSEALLLLGRAGLPPSFGDDDGGRVFDSARNSSEHLLDPLATGAVLFGRGDFKFVAGGLREETLWLLGEAGVAEWERIDPAPPQASSAALADSGLYLMPTGPNCQLVVDAGPLGALAAGHGHADALSVCVIRDGHGLLIDSGTLEYVGPGTDRNVLRGTGAHNTLRVDGAGQADVQGPFSWGRLPSAKAEQWIQGQTFDLFLGSHDGYTRLSDPIVHRRWVFSLKNHFWLIYDIAEGKGRHRLEISWHFGPEIQVQRENVFGVRNGDGGLAILTVGGHGWSEEGHKDWCSPRYGQKQANLVVNFSTIAELPAEFVTLLAPLREATQPGALTKLTDPQKSRVKTYRYEVAEGAHEIYFAQPGEPWKSEKWSSDAEFVYCRLDQRNDLRHLILCNGTWVSCSNRRLVTCKGEVNWCELLSHETGVEVFSSDREAVKVEHPFGIVSSTADVISGDPQLPQMAKESL
jgi:hypothetical protein